MSRSKSRTRRGRRFGLGLESLEGRRLLSIGTLGGAPNESGRFYLVDREPTVNESDGQVVVTIGRDGDLSGPASLQYATRPDGTAMPGFDYIATSGTLNFAPGQAEAAITITIVNDRVAEPFETFSVVFTNPVGASYNDGEAVVGIEDDEPAGAYSPVFVDYGAHGLWTYNPAEDWAMISSSDPEAVVPTQRRDAYVDFGNDGLWHWDPQSGWLKLNHVNPQAIKLEESGDGVYVDFGRGGLWYWSQEQGYKLINSADPQDFLVGRDGLVIDFGSSGLWRWDTNGKWTKLNHVDPVGMVGDPMSTVYINFGHGGLWSLDQHGTYAKISDHSPRSMGISSEPIDAQASFEDVLYLDFGAGGFWKWGQRSNWTRLNDLAPESFVIDHQTHTLYIDFGHGGLWSWSKTGGYRRLNTMNPELIAFSALDGNLYIDYGAAGFWRWTSADGHARINAASPSAIAVRGV